MLFFLMIIATAVSQELIAIFAKKSRFPFYYYYFKLKFKSLEFQKCFNLYSVLSRSKIKLKYKPERSETLF